MRCGAYGPMMFFFVQTRSVGLQTEACGPMRCGACGPMRCGAYGPMLLFFVQTGSVGLQTDEFGPMRGGACGPMMFFFVQTRSVG